MNYAYCIKPYTNQLLTINIKNMKQILITFIVLLSIYSCKKDDNESKITLSKETISAKWKVNQAGTFVSFEFNKSGNYLIVKNTTSKSINSQIVLFGTYNIIDNNTMVLSDFGKIKVSQIEDTTINFSVVLDSNPNNEISIIASKQIEAQTSIKTELLCQTWQMVTINGDSVAGTEMELTVLFSAAGTYFVSYANPINGSYGGLAQWRWKDANETKLLYSWHETPIWEEESYVEIPEVSANKLIINEQGDIYILQSASNTKSVTSKASGSLPIGMLKSGFLKR